MRTTSTSEQKPRRRGTSYSLLANPGAVKAVRALQGHHEAGRTHRDQDADRSHCDPWHRRRRPLVGPPDVNVPGVNLGLEFPHWVLRPAWSPPTVGRDPHKRHRLRLRPGAADAVPHGERPAPLDIAFAKADGRIFAILRMRSEEHTSELQSP